MKSPLLPPARRLRSAGFTLVELLTVIAIIAILAAVLVPTVGTAMKKAKENKTHVQLLNLVEACKQYKQAYRLWPTFAPPTLNADTAFSLKDARPRWVAIMSGQPDTPDVKYNKLKTPFYNYTESEVSADVVTRTPIDSFGNDDIYLVFNTNLSTPNQIDPAIVNGITMVSVDDKSLQLNPPQNPEIPIMQPCVAMSPGEGLADFDIITTWSVQSASESSGQ